MISLDDVTVSYGGFVLLDKINFHISETDKIGLVGKNGAGKSTVLKLIMGLQNPTSGYVDKPSDLSIGYLPQIMEHNRGRSVLEEALTVFESTAQIEAEISEVSSELAGRSDYESAGYAALIEKINELNDRLVMSHTEPPEVQCRKTLLGLGFLDSELSRKTETFSQGWNMRIELAKILLRQPKVLLLDEPTNHLDIESIEWLEEYLRARKCSIVLVSHDRKFLDTVTNRTVEIMLGRVHDYKVPYSQYLLLRAERLQQQTAAYENQQRMIQKTEDFIQAFRYKPTKSNQVQSRIKALEKLDRLQIDETDNVTLTVKFPPAARSGDVVFKGSDLTVGYPQKVVFRGANVEVKRGEKVALVGRNGEGKTTLMRVIVGELAPLSGEARLGHNVDFGYFAQNQEDVLDKKETVFSTLDRIAVGDIRTRLRDILAQFLFRGEDIDKRVSVLSGGERARLGMAKLMLQSHNLLLLDEPTNHMDIKSKEILKEALKAFDGTLIIVSHDRDFLDGLVDKLYEFRDGVVREHLGSVAEFLAARKLESLRELERGSAGSASASGAAVRSFGSGAGAGGAAGSAGASGGAGRSGWDSASAGSSGGAVRSASAGSGSAGAGQVGPKSQSKDAQASELTKPAAMNYQEAKEKSKEERKKRQRIAYLESEIEKLEKDMAALEARLAAPEGEDVLELTRAYLEDKRSLDALTEEWGSLI